MIPIRLRLEAAAPAKDAVLSVLDAQAKTFFGEEPCQLDGEVEVETETYIGSADKQRHLRWAAVAHYIKVEP